MPLIVCAIFFTILFSFEGCWHLSCVTREKSQLRRYQDVEHPRRHTSDCYIDRL